MNDFRVISFYTVDTPYEEVMNTYLLPSLKKFDIPYKIAAIKSEGDWVRNVALKPELIAKELHESPENLVFLDADCVLRRYPQLLHEIPLEFDLGLFYLSWKKWYRRLDTDYEELVSSCMFLRNNEAVRDLVDEWAKRAKETRVWEQKVLEDLLKERDMNVFKFPDGFNYIGTLPDGSAPYWENRVSDPVIEQIQISRKLKNPGRNNG